MALATPATLAGLSAAVLAADVSSGVSSGAISAFNWAQWEKTLSDTRRKDAWRRAAGEKVAGSRRMIYDTRQRVKAACPPADQYQYYGGPFKQSMGRMTRWSSKQVTATEIAALQHYHHQSMMPLIVKMHEQLNKQMNKLLSHQLDAMAYALGVHDELVVQRAPRLQLPRYHERASTWQAPLVLRNLMHKASIVSGALRSGTLSSEPPASNREPSWRMPGGRRKTRSKSTA